MNARFASEVSKRFRLVIISKQVGVLLMFVNCVPKTFIQVLWLMLQVEFFSLKRDIEEIRNFLNSLAKSSKWRVIVREARLKR
jgi:hypothetical protein